MRRKRALVVDDSKTARQFLTNKLSRFEIEVETRDSAASAIDYLYSNTPDAVFMDFEMPGMDGFQALKIIKSNPNTATIPVMMYTSRSGGIELSQARALGAVGVLPKQLEPQNLEAVMRQLHLMPEQESLVKGFQHQADEVTAASPPSDKKVEYLHQPDEPEQTTIQYPADTYDQSVFVLKRQTRIFQKELQNAEKRLIEKVSVETSKLKAQILGLGQTLSEQKESRWPLSMLIMMNMAALTLLGYLLWQQSTPSSYQQQLANQNSQLQQDVTELRAVMETFDQVEAMSRGQNAATDANQTGSQVKSNSLELLEWAANRGTAFDYGVNPFDDVRALWLSDLVQQMRAMGFEGVVNLKANYGNFCLKKSETGGLMLAGDQDPFDACLFSSETTEKGFAQSSYQTLGFANYLNALVAEDDTPIEVFVDTDEYGEPVVPYPAPYNVKTAGEWNTVARQNQRILVSMFSR